VENFLNLFSNKFGNTDYYSYVSFVMREKETLNLNDMKSKKIKLMVNGMNYVLPADAVRTNSDGTTYIYGRGPIAGSMVKQYVKSKYPTIECSVKSSSFANGNSLDVYISNPNGSAVPESIYTDVSAFANSFEYGRYNGMEEYYEYYDESGLKSDMGTPIDAGVKYVSVSNKPAFGSVGDCVRMLNDMMSGKYVWGPITLEKAIEKILDYKVPQSNINKAMGYLA
jgi:hypothetical protein